MVIKLYKNQPFVSLLSIVFLFPLMLAVANAEVGQEPQAEVILAQTKDLSSLQLKEKDIRISPPKQIALLLPITGPFAGPGQAIKDGFMASHHADSKIKIKVYDTNKGSIVETYDKAIEDGADYVIGPLIKSQVAAIAKVDHPVPTLLLNHASSILENAYTFGLSPINEAKQVAIKAHKNGFSRALIIAPKNSWGFGVVKAFTQQWEKKGGVIADSFYYGPKEDMSKGIREVLQVNISQQRENQFKELLGWDLQFVVGRRQDFDMIFLLAYPSKARHILPLLRYYYADKVPVYATSTVYSGQSDTLHDRDLEGVIFCDIPWVFSHHLANKNWPEQFNSYNRLYAIGKDSYALATKLNPSRLFTEDQLAKDSGFLYSTSKQHIVRKLEWGQFKQGLAHSIG